jgi:hypothetical protein
VELLNVTLQDQLREDDIHFSNAGKLYFHRASDDLSDTEAGGRMPAGMCSGATSRSLILSEHLIFATLHSSVISWNWMAIGSYRSHQLTVLQKIGIETAGSVRRR